MLQRGLWVLRRLKDEVWVFPLLVIQLAVLQLEWTAGLRSQDKLSQELVEMEEVWVFLCEAEW